MISLHKWFTNVNLRASFYQCKDSKGKSAQIINNALVNCRCLGILGGGQVNQMKKLSS